jgi:Flp pilus assembly protein TadB
MEDLGDLGFWLGVGIVVAAAIIAHGLKEREKERQRQQTLREMMRLEAEGKLTPETLNYMRERDAAEQAERDRERAAGDPVGAGIIAFIVGLISLMAGLAILAVVIRVAGGPTAVSLLIAVPAMLAIWYGGLRLAVRAYRAIRRPKKPPPPGA